MIWLALTLIWSGLLTWIAAVAWTAWALLRPPRLTPARAMARLGRMSPSDLGFRYCEGQVEVAAPRSLRLRLAFWWIPATTPAKRTVVIVHGYADSRAGALAWAPVFLHLGWNVVAVDLRAHGESGGAYTTAGILERHDIDALINEIRAARPESTRNLMLFGVSMGAAVVIAAAALRDDLAGVVVDSPVADFYRGAAVQLSLMGLAGPMVLRPGLLLIEFWLGHKFESIRPATLIEKLRCPLLAICPREDPFLTPEGMAQLADAISQHYSRDGISRLEVFEGACHLACIQQNPNKYKQLLNQFGDACTSDSLARRAGSGTRGENRPPALAPEPPVGTDVDSRTPQL